MIYIICITIGLYIIYFNTLFLSYSYKWFIDDASNDSVISCGTVAGCRSFCLHCHISVKWNQINILPLFCKAIDLFKRKYSA